MGPSEACPEEGETLTQESELLADQFLLAIKVMVPLPPATFSSMLEGLVIESSGAFSFWQEANSEAKQMSSSR